MTLPSAGATRVVLIGTVVFVLVMALAPRPPSLMASDKWQHMAAFATLSLLAALAYPRASLWRIGERLSFFGALIELLQALPAIGRDCDILDWLADTAAIAAVLIVVALVRRRRASAT